MFFQWIITDSADDHPLKGDAGRKKALREYTEEPHWQRLRGIYEEAIRLKTPTGVSSKL